MKTIAALITSFLVTSLCAGAVHAGGAATRAKRAAALSRSYDALWMGARSGGGYDRAGAATGKVIARASLGGEIVRTRSGRIHANFIDPMGPQNGVVSRSLGKNPVGPRPGDRTLDPQAARAYHGLLKSYQGERLEHAPPRMTEMQKFELPRTVHEHRGAYGMNLVYKNELYIDFKSNTAYARIIDLYTAPDGSVATWVKLGEPLVFESSN